VTEPLNKLPEPDASTADYYNSLGLLYASQQKHREATRAFQKALDLDSTCAEAFYNQALSLTAQGCLDEAIDCYAHALRVRPDFVDAYYNLGNLLQRKGLIEKAIENYSMSVKLKTNFPEAYNNLGLCLKALERFEQAVESYNKAIALRPDYAEAYNNLGLTLQDQGLWEQAIEKFESAIRLKPDHSGHHYNLGFTLNEIDQLDAAASHYRRSIQLEPAFADAHNNLGVILKTQGRIEAAISHFQTALEYSSDKAEIYNNLGNALKKCGRIDEALRMLQRALADRPDFAEAYNNLGVAFQARGNYSAAQIHYEKAIALKPEFAEARFNRATIDLLHGNFARGWQGYEWRFKKRHWQDLYPLRHNLPCWDGSPFPQKRLLVNDEQGFGDTIQFVRYLSQVKALGGTVIMGTRNPLVTCLQGMDGIDEVIDRTAVEDPAAGCDLVVSLLSLPGIFKTHLASIPAKSPYMFAAAEKTAYWKQRIRGSEFKVGLVWAGNPDHENDYIRSIPLQNLIALAEIPGLLLFALQKGAAARQMAEMPASAKLIDLGPELKDFSDTAAAMTTMDLIVSVDTAAAHLAGALGLPVWTLVYFAPDWRWMLDRDDSPWYPTMRLFHQQKHNDWQAVICRVTDELKKTLKKRELTLKINKNSGSEIANRHSKVGSLFRSVEPSPGDLDAEPKHAQDFHMLGVAACQKGDYERAKTLIGRALSIDSRAPLYYYNFGRVCASLGESLAAINAFRRAINLKPDYIEAYCSLGTILRDQQRFDEALKLFDAIVQISPEEAFIHHSRGQILSAQGRCDQAIEAFERAISLFPGEAKFYNSLGIARGMSGDQASAIEAFKWALRIDANLLEAVNNLGTAMHEQGEFDKALAYFNRAVELKPDYAEARFNRAAVQLLKGNFEQGWPEYECRCQQVNWKRSHSCPAGFPRWDGASFVGKRLCVHTEQGLGDTLQFLRYLPQVKNLGGKVILEISEHLAALLKDLNSVDELVVKNSNASKGARYDMCVHLLSLPGLFHTTAKIIPAAVPYIVANPAKVSNWKQKLDSPDFKVGLVWGGSPAHKRDRIRSIELARFGVLAGIPGLRLYGLQKGRAALQAVKTADDIKISNLGHELCDFSDTAALVENLDLTISVDTSVAHLAGAMGKPVWVMLPFVPDWRWMLDCDVSPWYPTMRLFRQPQPGNWDAVIGRLAEELNTLVASQ